MLPGSMNKTDVQYSLFNGMGFVYIFLLFIFKCLCVCNIENVYVRVAVCV